MTTNRSFTIDTDPKYKLCNIVVIRPVFLRFNNNGTVDINEVLLDLEDVIVESYSTEKTSQANSSATNLKRKLSSIEEIGRKAVGRRTDDSKDLSDGYFKLPIVMKDMLKDIIDRYTSLRNDVNIIGYNIQSEYISQVIFTKIYLSNKISFMNMDSPAADAPPRLNSPLDNSCWF
ncbi:hypothetical protein INT48_006679 [Thamnidium elegans]|uniref:Uncharacterized protein n=1 Tax=Thamnidium elegans TaxID=101142 RepID=A0A8H7VPX8_9FUNG|nr:hypothetical protein INT48_006679 [Thamnidium elegans]